MKRSPSSVAIKKAKTETTKKATTTKKEDLSPAPTVRIYQQETSIYQNKDGVVRKSFRVLQSNGEKVVQTEGVSNQKNASKYHILRTICQGKNEFPNGGRCISHGSPKGKRRDDKKKEQSFVISEKDILHLLKEGNRLGDYDKMVSGPKLKRPTKIKPKKAASKKIRPSRKI